MAFINQVTGEFRDDFDKKGMKLILNTPEYPIYCLLDGQKTYRVFENLITNILKYAQENTRVYITLDDGGDKVRITLKKYFQVRTGYFSRRIATEVYKGGQISKHRRKWSWTFHCHIICGRTGWSFQYGNRRRFV